MQSAILSWFFHFPHQLNLPTRSFTMHRHLIFFCCFPYLKSLPIRLCERYSEPQLIRSQIWILFIPCQLHVKLIGTLGWLLGSWQTLALGFQCVDFCVNTSFGMPGGTRSFNMVRVSDETEFNEGNYVPVDESKLKEDQQKNILNCWEIQAWMSQVIQHHQI